MPKGKQCEACEGTGFYTPEIVSRIGRHKCLSCDGTGESEPGECDRCGEETLPGSEYCKDHDPEHLNLRGEALRDLRENR